ncbi:lanthionine synthetase C family protein [Streptomyces sp. 8N616]|uniref:lanthionine synthetase C family protein n=1 Tax=Streptomyces sp. 8N616 TaxID=3457414 RepID=UPI003FD15B5C
MTALTEHLAGPDRVAAVATAPGNVDHLPDGPVRVPWAPLSLAEGHPGVALLFAELSRSVPRHRTTAHAHLSTAAQATAAPTSGGLFDGAAPLAFAAWAARHRPGDYATLLDRLDDRVTAQVERLLAAEEERLRAGRAGAPMHAYDVISGATGLGRYLLLHRPRHQELLARVLSYLVRLTEPVSAHGHTVPGWWVRGGPATADDDPDYPRGHFNLGLAHGIPGPMALLALAREAGVRVPGQDAAITRVCDWLLDWRTAGGRWPWVIPFERHMKAGDRTVPLPPGRTAWCYGTPGVAWAVYLAGRALSHTDWQRAAVDALAAELDDVRGLFDSSLCHGRTGVLLITWRMARDSGDSRLTAQLPHLAAPVLDAYDPQLPFGYRYSAPTMRVAGDRAGFLEGAAGIALALHTYATDSEPDTPWDAALLLS